MFVRHGRKIVNKFSNSMATSNIIKQVFYRHTSIEKNRYTTLNIRMYGDELIHNYKPVNINLFFNEWDAVNALF